MKLAPVALRTCCLALVVFLAACGAGHRSNGTKATREPGPRISVAPSGQAGSATSVPPPPGAATATGPGFAPRPLTPVATCAPADLLRLVDKNSALPADYAPPDLMTLQPTDASPNVAQTLKLRREAEENLHRMLDQARAANLFIVAQSTYRSYTDQGRVYQVEVAQVGAAQAERESARPGHSEHQLGTAVDFTTKRLAYDLQDSFGAAAEGRWLQANAPQYGFVLSYPQDKEAETGYMYEPWHWRYIGVAAAQRYVPSGMALNRWLETRQMGCQP